MKKLFIVLMLLVNLPLFAETGIIDIPSGIEPLVGFPAPVQDSIGPLLGDIAYNQGKPYNNMFKCHGISSQAVAMAMIARYWQWPDECTFGSLYDYCDGWIHRQKFTFDWANMKTQYTGIIADSGEYPESQAQQDAVAELLFACENILAYCLDCELSMYALCPWLKQNSDSASYIIGRSVRHGFEYLSYKSTSCVFTVNDQNIKGELITGIIREIDAGRPVYCESHLEKDGEPSTVSTGYVIDGYVTLQGDKNLTAPYFHFNFGWGGQNNGWYRITGTKDRLDYSSLNMIFYLEPDIPTENEMIFNNPTQNRTVKNNNIYIQSNGKRYDMLGREIQ